LFLAKGSWPSAERIAMLLQIGVEGNALEKKIAKTIRLHVFRDARFGEVPGRHPNRRQSLPDA